MNSIVFAMSTVGAIAAIFVLRFTIYIIRKWLEARKFRQHGTESTARILQAQVINESGRYLPFVRLKLEVMANAEKSFITEADSFFSIPELPELMNGTSIHVRYNPKNLAQVKVVKKAPVKNKAEHSWQPFVDTRRLALAR